MEGVSNKGKGINGVPNDNLNKKKDGIQHQKGDDFDLLVRQRHLGLIWGEKRDAEKGENIGNTGKGNVTLVVVELKNNGG